MRKMCKSMLDDSRPCGKLQQSGMYPLWQMPKSLSDKCNPVWNQKKITIMKKIK